MNFQINLEDETKKETNNHHINLFGATRDQTGGENQCSLLHGEFTGQIGPCTARDRSKSVERGQNHLQLDDEMPDRIIMQSPPDINGKQTLIFDLRNVRDREDEEQVAEAAATEEVIRCTCPRNNCAKAYCKCFFSGVNCDPNRCTCQGCTNHEAAEGFEVTLRRRKEFKETRRGANALLQNTCNCSKTGCSKKYCPCFRNGQGCHQHCNC